MGNGRAGTVRCGSEAERWTSLGTRTLHRLVKRTLLAFFALLFLNGCTGFPGGSPHLPPIANFAISPGSVNFGTVASGQKTSQNIRLTNMGKATLTIQEAALSNPQFSVSGVGFPATITAGQSTSLTVWMNGTKMGPASGTLTVRGEAGMTAVQLSGTVAGAMQPQLSLNSGVIDFGTVSVGSKVTSNLTISNSGGGDLVVSVITLNGAEFGIGGIATPRTIGAGQAISASVTFTPSAAGTVTGAIVITSNDSASPTTSAMLTGIGTTAPVGQLSANSRSLSFGNISSGSSSTQNITLTNTGNAAVAITNVATTGNEFTVNGITIPTTLNPSQSATLVAKFAPTSAGIASGAITVANNGSGAALVIGMIGTGTPAGVGQLNANPTNLNFGSTVAGSSNTRNITLTNTGIAAVTISSVAAGGSQFAVSGMAIPTTLNPSQSATLVAKFAPTSTGIASGAITVVNNGSGSALVIGMTGTGTPVGVGQLNANPTTLNFGSAAAGSSGTQNITLKNTGAVAVHISSAVAEGSGFSVSGWSSPVTLNVSETAVLSVKFAPTGPGNASGSLKVTSDAPGSPLTIGLSGAATQAGLSLSPATFNFGSVVGGQIKSQNFTLSNTGTAPLTITQVSAPGSGYSASGLTAPTTIAVGKSATFSVLFAPTTAGSQSGGVSIASNAPNSPSTFALNGTGVASLVTISANPANVSFGSVSAGKSASKSVTVTNSGNTNVTISQINVSATDVTASGLSTPLTLTPGQNAAVNLTFSPKVAESVTGNVTVTSAQGTSAVIPLTASAVQAGLAITPSSVNFGSVTMGSPNSQTIQLTNSGTGVLTVMQLGVTGSGFTSSTVNLPLSLNPGASSTFNVQFAPQTAGNSSGGLSILSNAPNSPSTVALSGSGIAASAAVSLSTATLNFGSLTAGSSASQMVTITDTGNANVTISAISIAGTGFTLSGAGTPVTLSPSQAMTIGVQFSPATAGNDTGSVTISSNANGSPAKVTLSGSGVAQAVHSVMLNWNASASAVSGYNVYRSTVSGSGYSKLNGALLGILNYTDSAVQSGQTYYYVTTAVDSSGDESSYSNQAQAIIP
jgi:hypothetical protein